ncbi:hypothetical protein TREMEDRAFT_30604 [Tremella mesenterica DSM 1558]|uniref:uncharacterized protein n=1 Tax=Tremella mesenterica (strain ATCC 24925 / CBS 8224 / DSM 1558 / NBRC 9311 / NRRL Y-6157 / RJB 2259-6 / UBC 559-6) TaxID=578456 RepID=UPI0003F49776|nr:uncharacterized protein TREMEDRAFT_30604 [Tremella mesenterica DSM 1558]EIW69485.1 hypothetical protein TREMEDRAFT_30604 [Tremella mesenterica DSM 1558]
MSSTAGPSAPPRGMPILSGPPPVVESDNCRACGKQFNPLWRRPHPCGHCGYQYCSACLGDGQALMPRKADSGSRSSGPLAEIKAAFSMDDRPAGSGYDVEEVCLHCLGMLQVTAASLNMLRALPLKRLKEYLAAYGIECMGPREKEDFVQAVVRAKDPSTGCLSPDAENYYRRKSVPKFQPPPAPPPPQPQPQQPRPTRSTGNYNPYVSPGPYPPPPQYMPNQHNPYRPPPTGWSHHYTRPPPPRPAQTPPRPKPAPSPAPVPARPPTPPIPTVLSLVSLPKSYLSSLTVGQLKGILYENHVKVDFKQVLEKDEVINRVWELVQDERHRLERQRAAEEAEENGGVVPNGKMPEVSSEEKQSKVPTGPMPDPDRGLCIVCQDAEATLAVVDCGHLCMCGDCSDIIMATSQECPLCRTRIVTKQRLIRIYRP